MNEDVFADCSNVLLKPKYNENGKKYSRSDDIVDTIGYCEFTEPFTILNANCDILDDSVDGFHEACGWKPALDINDNKFAT